MMKFYKKNLCVTFLVSNFDFLLSATGSTYFDGSGSKSYIMHTGIRKQMRFPTLNFACLRNLKKIFLPATKSKERFYFLIKEEQARFLRIMGLSNVCFVIKQA